MYFLDPVRGRKRRARLNEAMLHAERHERELFQKASRDAKHRMHGLVERTKHRPSASAPNEVVDGRVRAALGRAFAHSSALDIEVQDGRATLRGAVLAKEAERVLRTVRHIAGIREVVDRMERHETADTIPALKRAGRPPRRAWTPTAQAAATGIGAAMFLYGWFWRGGISGKLLGAAGGALALRGTLNRPIPELVGRGRGISVQKTLMVNRPVHDVFDLLSRLDNFPAFMEHVRDVDVELGGRGSRWTVDGPAGTRVEFDAETVVFEPDRLIAWKTKPNQPIEHEGRVHFEPMNGGTRVHVQMTYRPPGGIVGHAVAHILGWDPKSRMDDDLMRMKALLEDGKTRAHQQRVELADLH
jgi:uncharacterized membrane protein